MDQLRSAYVDNEYFNNLNGDVDMTKMSIMVSINKGMGWIYTFSFPSTVGYFNIHTQSI